MKNVSLLDCTLRDGGLGLEDSYKNGVSDVNFSKEEATEIAALLSQTDIEIVELGSIEKTKECKTKFCIYQSIEEVSKAIPKATGFEKMYVALFRGPDTPYEEIPHWRSGLVEGIRVILRYSELEKSLDFCEHLSQKGYKVFVQPMLTMRYTPEELNMVLERAKQMRAYACYFVDSYGYMTENDVARFFETYANGLPESIKIGFHAHNNMDLAFSNVKKFAELSRFAKRDVIIDSCVYGMGQGAGNLQTEVAYHYCKKDNPCFIESYPFILAACEIIERKRGANLWGYSVATMLPAIYKTAYKYSIYMRFVRGMKYTIINDILRTMPDSLRHRYTKEDAERLIGAFGERAVKQ